MGNPLAYLAAVPTYLGWFGVCASLLGVFVLIYCWITPKDEIKLIREGNVAAAVSLMGATIGFSIMMSAVMMNAANRVDLIAWTLFGLLIQLLAYTAAALMLGGFKAITAKFEADDRAASIIVAGMSVSVGLISAAIIAS